MADPETEDKIVTILANIIDLLGMSVSMMEQLIEKPEFVDAGTPNKRFRFKNPTPQILQVLKCVRVVSGLRASVVLLVNDYTTEMAVLFRTIDDFLADIAFVDEIIEKGLENVTTAQKRYLEQYFVDDKRSTEELLENRAKINYNELRQKVQASQARTLGGDDPHHVKTMVRAIDDGFSGFVHGNYSSVMEMYGGDTLEEACFHTDGVPVRFSEHRHQLGLSVHLALNMFLKVAFNLGHEPLAFQLRELRRQFEESPAYTAT